METQKQRIKKMGLISNEQLTDKLLGQVGSPERDAFESELAIDLEIDKTNSDIGASIARMRTERKLTQQQLAKLLGVSTPQISKIESGRLNMSVRKILLVSRALGYDLNIVFEKSKNTPSI